MNPGISTFGFRIRWHRPPFVINYDIHRVVGILSLPLVALVALTGTGLVFYEVGGRVVHALFFTTPEAAAGSVVLPASMPPTTFTPPLTLDEVARTAERLRPGEQHGCAAPRSGQSVAAHR